MTKQTFHARRCAAGAFLALSLPMLASRASAAEVSVGPQYDSTHVYVAPANLDVFVKSFAATFGGAPSKPVIANVLPVPSRTAFRYVMTPVGTLSVFAFQTPIPFPFGSERTGYLVTDMDKAIAEARASGAEVMVAPFKDALGRDAVIRWPGEVTTQLYWHFTAPNYPALKFVPDNRVYVSPDRADEFVRDFLRFSGGKVVSDDAKADAGEIGRPGEIYRCIRVQSGFGKMQVLVTDGHLPYPFGRELMGYEVDDLSATLAKAKAAGAMVLSQPYAAADGHKAIVQFPGGYIAEIHDMKKSSAH